MQIQYYEFNLKKSFLYDEKFCFSYESTINLYYTLFYSDNTGSICH